MPLMKQSLKSLKRVRVPFRRRGRKGKAFSSKEKTQEKQAKLQNLSALFKAFHELGDNLDTLQSDYKKPRSHPRKQLPIMKQKTAHFWMSRLESSLKLWKTVSPALFADLWNTLA